MRRRRLHLAIAGALLVVTAVLVPVPDDSWPARLLVGWVVGSLSFVLPVLRRAHRLDADETGAVFEGAEGGRTETDVIVVLAAFASLAAVAVMLVGGQSPPSVRTFEAVLSVLAVAAGWVALHTVYALRYARHVLAVEPGCIDFNTDQPPRLSDFVYLAFTLGMTYQVSDTALRTPRMRSLVLGHTVLSYVFGTVIVATTINLVVGLASSGSGG